jgi:hypothetical protein
MSLWVCLDRGGPPLAPPNVRLAASNDQNVTVLRLVVMGHNPTFNGTSFVSVLAFWATISNVANYLVEFWLR